MKIDGYMTRVFSPFTPRLTDQSLARIHDAAQAACHASVRAALVPRPPERLDLTVAVAGFRVTFVEFRRTGSAAAAFLFRAASDAGQPEIHGIALIFPGLEPADEADALLRTAGGRDSNGQPYPSAPTPPARCSRSSCGTVRPPTARL